MIDNKNFQSYNLTELVSFIEKKKHLAFSLFIKELNRREKEVRFDKINSFQSFSHNSYESFFKYGFIVDGRSVPYFHPNRSFHDEIIWLNNNVFYNKNCTYEDMLINAALVKFYGPSNTISIITRNTGCDFIVYDRLMNDEEYLLKCMVNIESAKKAGETIYGTTELRTSLQTESRNYTRSEYTVYDKYLNYINDTGRVGRCSDILYWFKKLGPLFVDFYSKKPSLEESYNFLTSFRGIGDYYGYHLSTNLARMPFIGTKSLVRSNNFGNLDEDDDFVAPGVGAMISLTWLFKDKGFKINKKNAAFFIRLIRDNQKEFFMLDDNDFNTLSVVSELGRFTTFGCEISCCQFGVFLRLRNNKKMALKRSLAPISREV